MTYEEYQDMDFLDRVKYAHMGMKLCPLSTEEKQLIYDYLKKCGAEGFYESVFIEDCAEDFLRFAKENELMSPCAIHQYLVST